MTEITTNDRTYKVEQDKENLQINGNKANLDIKQLRAGSFSVISNNKNYQIEVIEANYTTKQFTLKVNGKRFELKAQSELDKLLEKLGMDTQAATLVKDLKAPMPGLILAIQTEEGQQVNEGDTLLILEAMKMENVIKSPREGVIKSIKAKTGENVEKNQLLITFE
ncbi:acetyl-CoA carboxylase biotin carboxyl carrier protein subunit [Limibacter armeniacum]|uniref:acetyl-CoA carboxylase biotin carboxyl carrier protein subunit n=1 Tax=Limibacter armeniacum TaxID=466084 RepID=UPI002FE5291E